jgi:hypothetical protein
MVQWHTGVMYIHGAEVHRGDIYTWCSVVQVWWVSNLSHCWAIGLKPDFDFTAHWQSYYIFLRQTVVPTNMQRKPMRGNSQSSWCTRVYPVMEYFKALADHHDIQLTVGWNKTFLWLQHLMHSCRHKVGSANRLHIIMRSRCVAHHYATKCHSLRSDMTQVYMTWLPRPSRKGSQHRSQRRSGGCE